MAFVFKNTLLELNSIEIKTNQICLETLTTESIIFIDLRSL